VAAHWASVRVADVQGHFLRSRMKRFHKIAVTIIVGLLAAPLVLYAYSVLTLEPFPFPKEAPLAAETETLQTAMNAMMEDKNFTTVSPNDDTNNSLGVNTWTDFPEGPGAASLDSLLRRTTTKFYYFWDSNGNVYAQNKTDSVKAKPKDAD